MATALEGLRVLDLTRGMAGALATMILADYGAEVVRIEPGDGDPLWEHPASLLWNRGKKSVAIDFGSDAGRRRLQALAASSHVLVETIGSRAAERLGVGWPDVQAANARIVYCSISAFGESGTSGNRELYGGVVDAKSGRMRDQAGHQGARPTFRAVADTSFHTAMFSLQAILAGLRVASVTGAGQRIETSALRGTTAPFNPWLRFEGADLPPDRYPADPATATSAGESAPVRRMETDPVTALPSQLCAECKDGRWIMHCHPQADLFRAWIEAIGMDWIWTDRRFEGAPVSFPAAHDRVDLNKLIFARMKERTSAEWLQIYRENPDCVGELVQTTQEALARMHSVPGQSPVEVEDPRVGTVAQVGPLVVMSETPARITAPAPVPGQHSGETFSPAVPAAPSASTGVTLQHPLDGIVVLEIASWLATPFGTALLAELGARVIKVEPLAGDPHRGAQTNEHNRVRANQGKESVAVNLKSRDGAHILQSLIAKADVLVHNLRPGVPERLGFDYESARRLKPDLLYLYSAGYGSGGPDSARGAFNPTVSAFSGTVTLQSGAGNSPLADPSADPVAGSVVATAVLLGLVARLRTGRGQYLETSMVQSSLYCNSDDALDFAGKPPRRMPDALQLGIEATYRLYQTKDGWVFLAAPTNKEFQAFCRAAGLDALASDDRFSSWGGRYEARGELGDLLADAFRQRTAVEWESHFLTLDVNCVRADGTGYRRFIHEDRLARQTGLMVPARQAAFSDRAAGGVYWRHGPVSAFSMTPSKAGQAYETLGSHTEQVLREHGYADDEIGRLERERTIYRAKDSSAGS
jgi:crotonobetainyl-CoA:carnitine CoA-transferase CaiB-like acyl-CoA transferase